MNAEKQLMDAFKLNLYESRVYLSLLGGPMDPKGIAKASRVPLPRTYDVLSSLESKGFVERRSNGFSAISPRAALASRNAQFERAFQKEQEERGLVLADLVGTLEPAFKTTTAAGDEVAILHGINAIASKFNEILPNGKDIMLVVRRAVEAKEFFVHYLESEPHSKPIRLLVSSDARLGDDELSFVERLGLEVKQADGIFFDAMVADDDLVMIGVPDPLSEEAFHSLAVVIRSRSFNRSIRNALESVWGTR